MYNVHAVSERNILWNYSCFVFHSEGSHLPYWMVLGLCACTTYMSAQWHWALSFYPVSFSVNALVLSRDCPQKREKLSSKDWHSWERYSTVRQQHTILRFQDHFPDVQCIICAQQCIVHIDIGYWKMSNIVERHLICIQGRDFFQLWSVRSEPLSAFRHGVEQMLALGWVTVARICQFRYDNPYHCIATLFKSASVVEYYTCNYCNNTKVEYPFCWYCRISLPVLGTYTLNFTLKVKTQTRYCISVGFT